MEAGDIDIDEDERDFARPHNERFEIGKEIIDEYRNVNLTWVSIAKLLKTTTETLFQWRRRNNYVDPGIVYDETVDIDELILTYLNGHPERGERMTLAYLRTVHRLRLTRQQVREAIGRVDPEGLEYRRLVAHHRLVRREYSVKGPLHLWYVVWLFPSSLYQIYPYLSSHLLFPWITMFLFFAVCAVPRHMDGHHKLIRYGMVTHGCIDGRTRTITWIQIANDNLATTPLRCFREAIKEYGVPSRMRGDYGGENVLVADAMIQLRGTNRGSYLCGSSRFNTRIERTWRDVRRVVRFCCVSFLWQMIVYTTPTTTTVSSSISYAFKYCFSLCFLFCVCVCSFFSLGHSVLHGFIY